MDIHEYNAIATRLLKFIKEMVTNSPISNKALEYIIKCDLLSNLPHTVLVLNSSYADNHDIGVRKAFGELETITIAMLTHIDSGPVNREIYFDAVNSLIDDITQQHDREAVRWLLYIASTRLAKLGPPCRDY